MQLYERPSLLGARALLILGVASQPVHAVDIVPTFGTSITSRSNAGAIEADIDYTIGVMNGLYTNDVTVPITFQLAPLSGGATAQSSYSMGLFTLQNYATALIDDSGANPNNTTLYFARSLVGQGNCCGQVLLTSAEAQMLGQYGLTDPYSFGPNTITLNSNVDWTYAGPLTSCVGECRPVINSIPIQSGTYDANQALFHEMDEVLGGGGGGSTLNDCLTFGGQYCHEFGTTDLYRFTATAAPSYTTAPSAEAYMSYNDGGTDAIGQGIDFLTPEEGDAGDFNDIATACVSYAALIQGYSCAGTMPETYSESSPEFAMMAAIGWDHTRCTGRDCPVMRSPGEDPINGVMPPETVPEPSTLWLLVSGISILIVTRAKLRARKLGPVN